MKVEGLLLDQPESEVRAAMAEEGCGQCFGCPAATMTAASIVHRTNLLLNFTHGTQAADSEFHTETEQEVEIKRDELKKLTGQCSGYSTVKRQNGRPAKMCDSPESKYPRISVVAGRILEFLRIP